MPSLHSWQAVQNLRVLRKLMSFYDDPDEKTAKKIEWGRWIITHGFVAVEQVRRTIVRARRLAPAHGTDLHFACVEISKSQVFRGCR